jgi:hypothetical protein
MAFFPPFFFSITKGALPDNNMNNVHPALQTSHLGPYGFEEMSSGGTKAGVPHLVFILSGSSREKRRAKPKSASFMSVSSCWDMIRRFSGLISRWAERGGKKIN